MGKKKRTEAVITKATMKALTVQERNKRQGINPWAQSEREVQVRGIWVISWGGNRGGDVKNKSRCVDGSEKVGIEESRNLCAQVGTEIPAGGKESEGLVAFRIQQFYFGQLGSCVGDSCEKM